MYIYFYRPRSEASEGYVFTGICLSNSGGGGGQHLPPARVKGHNTFPPGQHLPVPWTTPPSPLDNTGLPPAQGQRSQHLPPAQGQRSQTNVRLSKFPLVAKYKEIFCAVLYVKLR